MYRTLFIWIGLLLIFSLGCKPKQELIYNSTYALEHIQNQLSFGPRIPSSEGSELAQNYIQNELENNGWIFETQEFVFDSKKLVNVIGKSSNNPPDLLIGTHYDTREFSDQETNPEKYYLPVPGANDGASGTAVLLELSRILDPQTHNIWFAFFDGEDQGFINDWSWSVGAQYFADQASEKLTKVVIVDMIADKNLNIFKENNSNAALCDEIWTTAEMIGHDDFFINEVKIRNN